MSYAYNSLENALELAVLRVPVKEIGSLLDSVEYVISNNLDARMLEDELLTKAGAHGPRKRAFHIERIANQSTPDSAAAA